MSDIKFKLTAATNVGLVRTNNEDNFIVNPDLTKDDWNMPETPDTVVDLGRNGCLLVVADGMGGMNAGEVASELAVQGVRRAFSQVKDFSSITDTSSHIEEFLKKVIVDADSDIKDKVKQDPSTEGMGTTIVLAWIIQDMVHVAWCGDSRAYLFNRQSGLSRISRDHSFVQELVDSGKLDPELAFDHPNSNIITRSLGDFADKARPEYVSRCLSAGDYILLCSDGLCGLVRDDDIMAVLMQEHETLAEYENDLFTAALEAGGHDNITIALFECLTTTKKMIASTLGLGKPKNKANKESKASKEPKEPKETEVPESSDNGTVETPKPGKKRSAVVWIIILLLLAAAVYGLWRYGYIDKLMSLYKKQFKTVEVVVEKTPEPQVDSTYNITDSTSVETTPQL